MVGIFDMGRDTTDLRSLGAEMTALEVDAWFVREVLPLEAVLMQYLRRNWRDRSDLEDIRQDICPRLPGSARGGAEIRQELSVQDGTQLPH